nr:terminase small subunit [uncultured Trichococcus sp.]
MNWENIRAEFENTDISLKDLAEKHGIKTATLRSRKSREKWQKRGSPDDATQRNKNATQRKNVATKKKVAPKAKEILESSDLEDWEEVFCLEYLKHFNKTKAYQKARAGIAYESARTLGPRLFAEVRIQKRLSDLKSAKNEQLFIQSADIDEQWAKQAFSDVSDFVEFGTEIRAEIDDEGNLQEVIKNFVRFKNASEIDGSLIQEVKMGRDGPVIKLYDKQKAMQELQKRLGDGSGGKQIIINNPWGVPYGPKPD